MDDIKYARLDVSNVNVWSPLLFVSIFLCIFEKEHFMDFPQKRLVLFGDIHWQLCCSTFCDWDIKEKLFFISDILSQNKQEIQISWADVWNCLVKLFAQFLSLHWCVLHFICILQNQVVDLHFWPQVILSSIFHIKELYSYVLISSPYFWIFDFLFMTRVATTMSYPPHVVCVFHLRNNNP